MNPQPSDTIVDKYLQLEESQAQRQTVIDDYESKIRELREAVVAEKKLQDQEGRELKRLYHDMSKEEFRELGKREANKKIKGDDLEE